MKNLLLKIKRCSVFFLLVSSALLFAGCSSKPSAGDGKQAVQNQINQDAQGRIKLVEFHKANGQLAEINAVKVYSLEFEAEIEFTEDCKWVIGNFGSQLSFVTAKLVAPPASGFSWNKFIDDANNPGTAMKQGQQVKVSGVIRFEKKENGWSVDGIAINHATPVAGSATSASEVSQQTPQPTPVVADVSHAPPVVGSAPAPNQQQTNQTSDSEELMVVKVLKQIDNSKNEWALENAKRTGDIPTAADLKRFFPDNEFPVHPLGGNYIINALGQSPESSKYGKLDKLEAKFHDQLYPKPYRSFENMTPNQLQNLVANDLRQINAAKQQWALEKASAWLSGKERPEDKGKNWSKETPSEDDLKPYLYGGYFPEHPPGGHYIINQVDQVPESSTYGKLL
jgi:hypothetical protein